MNRSERSAGRFLIAGLPRALRLRLGLVASRRDTRTLIINRLLFNLRFHLERFSITQNFQVHLFIQWSLGHERPQRAEILYVTPVEFLDDITWLNACLRCGRSRRHARNRDSV